MIGPDARLRRLAINDPVFLDRIMADDGAATDLDPHDRALVRIGVLVALDGPPSAIEYATSAALAAGATAQELVDVLISTAPLVGSAHVVSVAPRLARALGFDLDRELEGARFLADQP
jgi:alkylhydroperoxidase/carboxymuconolactone decarboxylase family protein YurZ